MQELVRDIHAVRLEISKAFKPRAVRVVDIAQPRLEYTMAEEDVCRAHALVEPFPDRLVREAEKRKAPMQRIAASRIMMSVIEGRPILSPSESASVGNSKNLSAQTGLKSGRYL